MIDKFLFTDAEITSEGKNCERNTELIDPSHTEVLGVMLRNGAAVSVRVSLE
jgi:hypothetical protein